LFNFWVCDSETRNVRPQCFYNESRLLHEKLDIYEIAFNTTQSLKQNADNKKIELIQNIKKNSFITCDMNLITTVFRNLVSNAIKFTNEGGRIEIGIIDETVLKEQNSTLCQPERSQGTSTKENTEFFTPLRCIQNDTSETDSQLCFYVKDNGIGITEKFLKKLFKIEEHFTTTGTKKEKGTGLGLILCKEFIEKHGGRIWVESEAGIGSTFYFILPVN